MRPCLQEARCLAELPDFAIPAAHRPRDVDHIPVICGTTASASMLIALRAFVLAPPPG